MATSPLDDLPVHQAAAPLPEPSTSDSHFNDGYCFAFYRPGIQGHWVASAILEDRAEKFGDRTFITSSAGSLTYAQLARGAAQVAGALKQLGIAPGDRVATMLPNGLDSCAIGPETIALSGAPPVLVSTVCRLNASSNIASSAATTTGKYSVLQPAMTALIAAFSSPTSRRSSPSTPGRPIPRTGTS